MKKFAKVMAVIALIMTVLGVVLLSVGAIGGGIRGLKALAWKGQLSFGPEDLRGLKWIGKWNYIWNETDYIGEWSEDIFDGEDLFDFDGDDSFEFDEDELFDFDYELIDGGSTVYETKTETIENLQVLLGGADVHIVQWDKDTWRVEAEHIGKFQAFAEGNTLKILGIKRGLNFRYCEVKIYMPRNANLKKAEIAIGAGDMEIEYLQADKAIINAGAGGLTIEKLQADRLQMNVGAGELTVKDSDIGDMELATGMGSMTVKGNITGNIDGNVAMGELKVIVCGSGEKDHNYDLSCMAGEMRVGSRYNAGLGMDMDIDNGADTTYKLECAMGSMKVTFQSEK